MSARRPLRLAIVGAAHAHVEYALAEAERHPDVEIVAVAEHDADRRAVLVARCGAPGYASVAAMLAAHQIDAAAVTTEPGLRAKAVAELARAGVFSIVDKPLATTLTQLDAVEAALAGRSLLTLVLEKRFYPATLALKQQIDAGALGDIVAITATAPHKLKVESRPDWYFDPALYGGVVNDLAVHDIDLALWLTGGKPTRLCGWASPAHPKGKPGFSLAGRVILDLETGVQASIDFDWLQPEASHRQGDYAMRVTGTLGRADIDFIGNVLTIETREQPVHRVALPPLVGPAAYAFDHLISGAPLAISTADSLKATRLALLAGESAATGSGWINV